MQHELSKLLYCIIVMAIIIPLDLRKKEATQWKTQQLSKRLWSD